MTSTLNGCLYLPCSSCKGYKFAPEGGRFHKTRICQACELFGSPKKPFKRSPLDPLTRTPLTRKVTTEHSDPEFGSPTDLPSTPPDPNPYDVQPGQVWRALDKREKGRLMEILSIEEPHAVVLSHGIGGPKKRKVRLDQFHPHRGRGYELNHDLQEEAAS